MFSTVNQADIIPNPALLISNGLTFSGFFHYSHMIHIYFSLFFCFKNFDRHDILLYMALLENSPTPAPEKRIPILDMWAANLVPVADYLKIRFQYGRLASSDNELVAITEGSKVIKQQPQYKLNDRLPLEFKHPLVNLARESLISVSLETYLRAKVITVEKALVRNEKKTADYRGIIGLEEILTDLETERQGLEEQINLVVKVAYAAGIRLNCAPGAQLHQQPS